MRKVEIEVGERLGGLLNAWTIIALAAYVVEKLT